MISCETTRNRLQQRNESHGHRNVDVVNEVLVRLYQIANDQDLSLIYDHK